MSIETITINIDEYNKMKKDIEELKEEKDAWGESEKYYNLFLDEYEKITNTSRPHRAVRNVIEAFKENEKMKKQITELTNGCNLKEKIIELEKNNQTLQETIDDNKRIEEGNKKLSKTTCYKLKEENEKLKEAIQDKNTLLLKWGEQEKISNVKTDLINELFSKIIKDADIDDGISISKEYGNKYIDEWNKIYEDIIKDTIETMNHNEFDCDELYLKFHTCDNIEFCNPETDEEEDSD